MENQTNQEPVEASTEIQKVEQTPFEIELASEAKRKAEYVDSMQKFTGALNSTPKKVAKMNEGTKHEFKYIPVSIIEKDLAKMFFGAVQYEVIDSKQVFNEMLVTARIKVFHPVLREWLHYDGVGASQIMQDSGTKVSDFHLFKKPNALQTVFPKAYAEAIKNAAKKIGKMFGSDVNRQIEDEYSPFMGKKSDDNSEGSTVLNK